MYIVHSFVSSSAWVLCEYSKLEWCNYKQRNAYPCSLWARPHFPPFFFPHIPDPSLSLFYPLFSILNMYIFTRRPQYMYSLGSLSSSFCAQENICTNIKETFRQYMTQLHTVRNNSMGLKFASCKANSNSIQSSASANSKLSENVA
jgi:hypothetical protein